MKKSIVSLNASRATAHEVAVKAATIVSKMSGNASFPAPVPALSNITNQVSVLNTKIMEQNTALQTYQQKTVEAQIERENLFNLLSTEAAYVQAASGGDELKILSAGFDVKQKSSPVGSLPAPKNLLADAGANEGCLNTTWARVKGANSYVVEMSLDINNPDNWEHYSTVTKAKCTLEALESGKRVWIRVAPINAAGRGAYSDPSVKTVP